MKNPNISNESFCFIYKWVEYVVEDSNLIIINKEDDEEVQDYSFSLSIFEFVSNDDLGYEKTLAFYKDEEINKETIYSKIDYILFA